MKEPYWRIRRTTTALECAKDNTHLIKPNDIYFVVQEDFKYPIICTKCFISYCDEQIALIKAEILDWENIKGKCQMREGANVNNTTK